MDLRQLRYFLAVAEELHFRQAAERLRIAQPALTRQIRLLEVELKVSLFDRSTRRVTLTAAGQVLRDEASSILQDVEKLRDHVLMADARDIRKLTVAYVPSAAQVLMPEVLKEFRRRFENVYLDLKILFAADQFNALLRSDIDVGILRPWRAFPEIEARIIVSEPFVIAVPDGHPAAGQRNVSFQAFADDRFIMHARPFASGATRTYEQIMELFRRGGFTPRIAPEAPQDMSMAMAMVAAGFGVSVLPRSLLSVRPTGVSHAELRGRQVRSELAVACRADRANPLVDAFMEAATAAARIVGLHPAG